MARLVLVNPPLRARNRFGDTALAPAGSHVPPLGLCSVAAAARSAGHTVALIDAEANRLDMAACLRQALDARPEVIGLTATAISVASAAEMAAEVRAASPDVRIFLGGVHLTSAPEDTLRRYRVFEAGVIGEGEITAVELLNRLAAGLDWAGVPGTIVRRPDGTLQRGAARPLVADLDLLPLPAFDLLAGFPRLYRPQAQSVADMPSTSIITSRGCTGQCTFCDRSVFGNRVRSNGPEYVLTLLRHLRDDYGVRNIQFEDDNLMLDRRRLLRLCQMLKAEPRQISWSCLARADCADLTLFTAMREAGCWCVMFGVESGSQVILDRLRKGISPAQIRTAVRLARKAGLQTKGFFLVGAPGETGETLAETERFALAAGFSDISLHMFTPFPGSADYAAAAQAGAFDDDWSKMNYYTPVFIPSGLRREDLESFTRRLLRRFYSRPAIWWAYLRRIHCWAQLYELSIAAWGLIRFILAAGWRKGGARRWGDASSGPNRLWLLGAKAGTGGVESSRRRAGHDL